MDAVEEKVEEVGVRRCAALCCDALSSAVRTAMGCAPRKKLGCARRGAAWPGPPKCALTQAAQASVQPHNSWFAINFPCPDLQAMVAVLNNREVGPSISFADLKVGLSACRVGLHHPPCLLSFTMAAGMAILSHARAGGLALGRPLF